MYKSHFLSRIIFVDLSSALVTQIPYVIFLYFGNFYCSVKNMLYSFIPSRKQRCCFSHGSPCKLHFQDVVCRKPHFLILICQCSNSTPRFSLSVVFHSRYSWDIIYCNLISKNDWDRACKNLDSLTRLAVCRRFAMVRMSDNGPGWK